MNGCNNMSLHSQVHFPVRESLESLEHELSMSPPPSTDLALNSTRTDSAQFAVLPIPVQTHIPGS